MCWFVGTLYKGHERGESGIVVSVRPNGACTSRNTEEFRLKLALGSMPSSSEFDNLGNIFDGPLSNCWHERRFAGWPHLHFKVICN